MTVPEHLSPRQATSHPSRPRTHARNGEVRANPGKHPDNTPQKLQNGGAFSHGTGHHAAQTLATCPCKLQTDQLPAIEIP
jgi:hypothetical protein